MARIPILNDPGQVRTGSQLLRPPELKAVTNEAVGQAIGRAGQVLEGVAEKAKRAKDVTILTDANIAMSQAQVEFAKYQQDNPDESTWVEKWGEITEQIKSTTDQQAMTPEARAQLSNRFTSWSTTGTINAQAAAYRQTGNNARLSVDTAVKNGQMTGDYGPAYQAVDSLVANNLATKDEGDNMRVGVEANQKQYQRSEYDTRMQQAYEKYDGATAMMLADKAHAEGLLSPAEYDVQLDKALELETMGTFREVAITDPVIARQKLKTGEFSELSPKKKAEAEEFADTTLRDYQMRERSSVADLITNGDDLSNYKFKWILDDTSQAEIRKVAQQKPPTPAQAATMRLDLEAQIGKYSLDADPDRSQMIYISAQVEAMKKAVPYAYSDLATTWATKKGGGTASLADMEIGDNDDYLAKLYKPKMDALLDDDKNIRKGKEGEFRRLQSEVTDLKQKYRQQIGENPTPEKARKLSSDILSLPAADKTVDYFRAYDGAENPLFAPTLNNSLPTTPW